MIEISAGPSARLDVVFSSSRFTPESSMLHRDMLHRDMLDRDMLDRDMLDRDMLDRDMLDRDMLDRDMLRRDRILRSLAFAALVASLGMMGCGTAPKPEELKELERILSEEGASEVKEAPGARKPYEESRELRRAALDEWEENDLELARQYAVRGKIRYRTAEAKASQLEAKERFDESKAKLQEINPKVQKLDEERNELRAEVQELHRTVQKAEQERARARKQEIQNREESANQERELAAQKQIDRALNAKREALDVRANEFAQGTFNRAQNELKSAQSLMKSGSFNRAESTAKSAGTLFGKAAKEARPKFDNEQAKKNPQKRLDSLTEKLEFNFGDRQVESVGRGVRVIIPELFAEGAKQISSGERADLDTLAELAEKFDEFDIEIEGYTRKGNATENLTISQVRAQRVERHLKDQGIRRGRISSDGEGQSNPRYPDQPSKNDRVEITFRLPR